MLSRLSPSANSDVDFEFGHALQYLFYSLRRFKNAIWGQPMRTSIRSIILIILIVFLKATPGIPDDSKDNAPIVLITDYTYCAGDKDSLKKSRSLAAFGANKKAVVLAAENFRQKGLLKDYGEQRAEIFCLVAGKIKVRLIQERYVEKENQYSIKIKAEVDISDFMEAEIENQALEREESDFPWKEEMEQHVSASIDPGRELSRAYRYIRKKQARIAIIYLDHLVNKYANWGDVYYARAKGFQSMHSVDQMMKDLERACALNTQEACNNLHTLK
jgi:hypothetical protein